MTETVLKQLKAEWLQTRQKMANAWAAFCFHRAMVWEFHAFQIITKSLQDVARRGRLPSKRLRESFLLTQKSLTRRVRNFPELERYRDLRKQANDAHLIYIHALMENRRQREGGSGDNSTY